jgi:hypothetical protein
MHSVIILAGLAAVMALPACRKSESRSTSIYTSTNDPSAPANRPSQADQARQADDDWDFAAPQGRMVVDPE